METTTQQVLPGQVWADNDWRAEGRTIRVESTHAQRWPDPVRDATEPHVYARCTILTDRDGTLRWERFRSMVGRVSWISLHRFRPTSTGYRLIQEAPHGNG